MKKLTLIKKFFEKYYLYILLVLLCLYLLSIPIKIFIDEYKPAAYSNELEKWGQFGDFIGGIYNPFLALLNLIVLIYITIEVSRIETKRVKEQIKFENHRQLNEFRYSAYNEYMNKLDIIKSDDLNKVIISPQTSSNIIDKLTEIDNYLMRVIYSNNFLFVGTSDYFNSISRLSMAVYHLKNVLFELLEYYRKNNNLSKELQEKYMKCYVEYENAKTSVLTFFQIQILNPPKF